MLARPPVASVEGQHLPVRTAIEAADGTELAPLEVRVPIAPADLLDPTATPGVAPLVALAAAQGKDLPEALDAVTAAMASRHAPLDGTAAATDARWSALPGPLA